jgi:hypothetical protein
MRIGGVSPLDRERAHGLPHLLKHLDDALGVVDAGEVAQAGAADLLDLAGLLVVDDEGVSALAVRAAVLADGRRWSGSG